MAGAAAAIAAEGSDSPQKAFSREPPHEPARAEEAASPWRLTLVLALSYGGRAEIADAAKLLAEQVRTRHR